MKIETKYNIGDRVWVIYEPKTNNEYHQNLPTGEIAVYDDYIAGIEVLKDEMRYILKYSYEIDLKEDEIILYNEFEKMQNKIIKMLNAIDKRENKKVKEH